MMSRTNKVIHWAIVAAAAAVFVGYYQWVNRLYDGQAGLTMVLRDFLRTHVPMSILLSNKQFYLLATALALLVLVGFALLDRRRLRRPTIKREALLALAAWLVLVVLADVVSVLGLHLAVYGAYMAFIYYLGRGLLTD